MALPQPNLDDKNFVTLVDEATKLIPRQAPGWTDHNRHDPGITFIELFAWLTEMQHYYLNRVGVESRLKFLKLLGLKPADVQPARTDVTFGIKEEAIKLTPRLNLYVPRGTKLTTKEGLIFETRVGVNVLPFQVRKALTYAQRGYRDNTDANYLDGLSFAAFGEEAEARSSLYLGFDDEFPPNQTVNLCVELADDYTVARGSHGDEPEEFTPSARIVWEYYHNTGAWRPLDALAEIDAAVELVSLDGFVEDDCFRAKGQLLGLIQSGPLFRQLTKEARAYVVDALEESKSPESFRTALDNATFLRLKHDETLMLSQSGRIAFDAPADMGRRPIRPLSGELFWLRAVVKRAGYELPPRIDYIGLNTVEAIERETLSEVVSFNGTGQPGQSFEARSYLALYGLNMVQVREHDGHWQDWTRLDNKGYFNVRGANEPLYFIKQERAEGRVSISFGDGEHGRVPPAGAENVRLISFLPEFREQRKLGNSTGMPGQTFTLDRPPAVAGSLLLQVEERAETTSSITVSVDVSCLLRFTRTVTAGEQSKKFFDVQLTLEARQDLCDISLQETLYGNLRFEPQPTPDDDFSVAHDKELNLRITRVRAGETVVRTYTVIATTQKGGGIQGRIVVSLAHDCPTVVADAPVTVIDTGDALPETHWRDWTRVDDFDSSGPSDAHFILDACAGVIRFGDGVRGDIPPVAPDENGKNIRLISYQAGGGERGNVVAGAVNRIARPFDIEWNPDWDALDVANDEAAAGGTGREEIEEAEARARRDLQTPYQAVNSADYETLALSTPGLRVARARAIPLYAPGLLGYPQQHAPASVTVVVVPFSTLLKPVPSPAFLQTVCRHLDRHRLLTTEVHVVAPEYVRVSVQATVLLLTGFDHARASAGIERALDNFLRPLPAEDDTEGTGWPFGRAVYKSEVYQLIENVEGVDCVEKVVLVAEGVGIARTTEGNILIPPQSLVYPGEHRIEIVAPSAECRSGR